MSAIYNKMIQGDLNAWPMPCGRLVMYCEMDFWSKLRVKYSSFPRVATYPLLLCLSCLYDILYVLTLSTFRIEDQPVQKRNQESEKLPQPMSTIKVCQVIYYIIVISYFLICWCMFCMLLNYVWVDKFLITYIWDSILCNTCSQTNCWELTSSSINLVLELV